MLTFGSLFAGVGGFDLGFEQAGWTSRWQVEWDKHCQQVLARHWPTVERFDDVRNVAGHIPLAGRSNNGHDVDGPSTHVDGEQNTRRLLEPVDVISFGSPCQDLSVAGRRAGLDGARSGLFHEAIRIIQEMRDATAGVRPRFAIWENVPGAFSSNKGDDFRAVIGAFADLGAVDVAWRVLDSRFFGVAQRRRRVFVVADFGGECAGSLLFEPAGLCRDSASCGTHETSATQSSACSTPIRRLTPRECERLQGFPDDHTRWRADGKEQSDSQRYRQMGNAVTVPVARWIAEQINAALQEET